MEKDPRSREPWATLERSFALARPVGRGAERLALVSLVAGGLVWWAVARGGASGVGLAVLAALLALPPVALAALGLAVRALVALPRKLRETPGAMRERGELIRRRAGDITVRGRGPLRRVVATGRLAWAVASSREALEVLGPTTILLTPWTVALGAIGAVAAAVEVVAGAIALIWLALA